jgi:membrane peptidoglycan carboxypeptidase
MDDGDHRPALLENAPVGSRPRLLPTLLKLLTTVLVAGALVAGLLLPWVGVPAVAAQQSAGLLGEPPGELTDAPSAGNTVLLAADGTPITWFYDENRQPVPAERMAPVVRQAIVAIEDSRFRRHGGLDVRGTTRALLKNVLSGGVEEGGSTLTQQLVKQTLLQTSGSEESRAAAVERTVSRKVREARLALALEDEFSKDELLTRYLNIVYFGHNAYGVQPAARAFFGVDAADLTLPQAALLAGVVQSPSDHDPFVDPEGATARRNLVLARMAAQGYVTKAAAREASAAPLGLAPAPPPRRGCVQAVVGAYVCDFVQQYLTQELGLSQEELEHGGYTIRTTLDVELQKAGDRAVLETLDMGQSLAGMFSAVEPGTGHLLALSTNRVFGFDRSDPRQESYNLFRAASRGAGSTYKVFVAAAALARGFSTGHTLTTSDPHRSRVFPGACSAGGTMYCVRNAGSYRSTLDMTTALYQSSNTYFLALEDELGSVEEPVRMAEAMGLYQFGQEALADVTVEENRPSFAFGPDATSPLALASAYSTLAASGTRCDVVPVTEILDRFGDPVLGDDGKPLAGRDRCTEKAIPRGVADTLNQMLRKDVEPGYGGQTGSRAYVPGHQIAGKTGTTQQNVSVAFVGYTPEIAASVMVLNPKRAEDVGGFGGGKGATIWHDAMAPVLAARGSSEFPPADPELDRGTVVGSSCSGAVACTDLTAAPPLPDPAPGPVPAPPPPVEEPPVEEPPVEEPPVEEPPVEEPPVEEPPVEEPPVEEPPVEEPPVEEPPVEEPPVEEPPVEEPPVDEPPVEEPPTEQEVSLSG